MLKTIKFFISMAVFLAILAVGYSVYSYIKGIENSIWNIMKNIGNAFGETENVDVYATLISESLDQKTRSWLPHRI